MRILLVVGVGWLGGCEPPDATDGLDTAPGIDYCEELGYPEFGWMADGAFDIGHGAVVDDMTVKTLEGSWNLAENWTGCDNYLFVPDTNDGFDLWSDGDVQDLLERLADNVHVFFFSTTSDAKADVEDLRDRMDTILSSFREKKREKLLLRLHYVKKSPSEWEGWIGDQWARTGLGFNIGPMQTLRDVGSLADPTRYDDAIGWFQPNIAYATYEAYYANFEAARFIELEAATDVEHVTVFDGSYFSGSGYATVEFPDAATMAQMDTLEYDLTLWCSDVREFGYCPPWDYLVYLYQCEVPLVEENPHANESCQPHIPGVEGQEEQFGSCHTDGVDQKQPCTDVSECPVIDGVKGTECVGYQSFVEHVDEVAADTHPCECEKPDDEIYEAAYVCNSEGSGYDDCNCRCDQETGRWITTYHREGRWVYDATPMLAYLQEGGPTTFRFYTSQSYGVQLDMRLSNTGRAGVPFENVPLFTGGGFNASYNDKYEPITVNIPADVSRVELVAVISGHGNSDQGCGEFCNHTHHFFVNGVEFVKEHPEADETEGCVEQVESRGMIPAQWGTWWYGRGGWCPGMDVPWWVVDVTDVVTPDGTAEISYEGRLGGQPFSGSGGEIRMNSYLTLSR